MSKLTTMRSLIRIAAGGCLVSAALVFTAATTVHAAPAIWMKDVSVTPGAAFDMPIMIDSTGAPMAGFDLELDIADTTVAHFTGPADPGDLFVSYFDTENTATAGHARYAAIDLGFLDHEGVFTLGILHLQAGAALGTTTVDFIDFAQRPGFEAVSNVLGEDLTPLYTYAGATIHVVPEPASAALLGLPLAALLIRRRA